MSVDIEAMSPEARAHYRSIGARYTTQDVLAQADMTMHGLSLYGPLLAPCGFGAEDAQDFTEGREDLRAQESGGGLVATDRKVISQNASDTLDKAKLQRQASIIILRSSVRVLRQRGNKTALALVQKTLKDTGTLDEDAQLPTHLALLQAALANPAVAEVAASRGGTESAVELTAMQPAVRTAKSDRAEHPALAAAAERRDILDGFVVTLARTARDASRIAARLHGQPAIAAAFELVHLRRKRRKTPDLDTPETPAPAGPIAAPEPPAAAQPGGDPVTASE